MLARLSYWAMAHAPPWASHLVRRLVAVSPTARRVVRRATSGVRRGAHRIAGGPARGMLMDVGGSRPSYLTGQAEPHLQEELASRLTPGDVFYDLGANVGYFTLIAARIVGPEGAVYAYEPLPANAEALRRNIELNGLHQVKVVEAAVSDRTGSDVLLAGGSDQQAKLGDGEGLRVKTVTIDDAVAAGQRPPTLLKIDVEGAEEAVVRGMTAVIATYRPAVVCEVHIAAPDMSHPVPSALRDAGYLVRWADDAREGEAYWAPHLIADPA